MNIAPLLSIIIPAYNSETTIKHTLQSIVYQHITPPENSIDYKLNISKDITQLEDDNKSILDQLIEVIVINDGSKDNTKAVVEELQSEYPFIKLYNKENEGVSAARNDGVRLSQGKYIAFLDADDQYMDGAINCIISTILTYDPDIIQYRVFTPHKSSDSLMTNESDITYKGTVTNYFKSTTCSSSVFSKIVRRELLLDCELKFSHELSIGEDVMWSLNLFNRAPQAQLVVDNFCLVRYNYNSDSVLNTIDRERLFKNFEAYIDFHIHLNDFRSESQSYLKKSVERSSRICQRGVVTRQLSVLLPYDINNRYVSRLKELGIIPLSGNDNFSSLINHCYKHSWTVQFLQLCYSSIVKLNLRKYLIR